MSQRLVNPFLFSLRTLAQILQFPLFILYLQNLLFKCSDSAIKIWSKITLHFGEQLLLFSLLLIHDLPLSCFLLLVHQCFGGIVFIIILLGMLLAVVLAKKLFTQEVFSAMVTFHGLGVVTFFWYFYKVFIGGQRLLLDLILFLKPTELIVVSGYSISYFSGAFICILILHI